MREHSELVEKQLVHKVKMILLKIKDEIRHLTNSSTVQQNNRNRPDRNKGHRPNRNKGLYVNLKKRNGERNVKTSNQMN